MNILFLGGTGNISADCAAEMHQRGHTITVATRGHGRVPAAYHAVVADRYDPNSLRQALATTPVDVVVDFLGFDVPDIETAHSVFTGRLRQYIFISTCVVYAKPHNHLPLTENATQGNRYSEYGRRKQACEERLLAYAREDGFPVTIVRPSHTYSCRWIPNPVASAGYTFAARLEQGRPVFVHGDGQNLWTLTATTDFAVALAGLAGLDDAVGEAFHITDDSVLTWNQIYAEICRALGIDDPDIVRVPTDFICGVLPDMVAKLKGDKAEHAVFDNAKIKRYVPDFECRKSFRQGIQEAIAWFRADPARQASNPAVDTVFDTVIERWRDRH